RNFAHQSCKSRRKLRYRHGTEHLRPAVSRKTAALSGEHQRTEYLVWWYAHTHTHTHIHTRTHAHLHTHHTHTRPPGHAHAPPPARTHTRTHTHTHTHTLTHRA